MSRQVAVYCLLAILTAAVSTAEVSSAELSVECIRRAKKATCLFEIPVATHRGFCTAFCTDRRGIFVTNGQFAKMAGAGAVNLVVEPGSKSERVLSARVLRVDDAMDLALLKADRPQGLESLELGKVDQLVEIMPLVAFGYSRSIPRTVEKAKYPSISVNLSRITSLQQVNGELQSIQFDAGLNPGTSGGPLLDGEGRVVGITQSPRMGGPIDSAIPVTYLDKLLSRPEITVLAPIVHAERQHQPHELTVQVFGLTPAKLDYTVELTISSEPDDVRTTTAKVEDGTAKIAFVPVSARQPAKSLRLTEPVNSVDYKILVKTGGTVVGNAAGIIDLIPVALVNSQSAPWHGIAPPGIAEMKGDYVTCNLLGPIDEVAAGGAGRYLLLHLRKLRKLAVFDVVQAKIAQYLPLDSDDVLFAASMKKLVIVLRDQKVIQRYDLATLQLELSLPLPDIGQLDGLALGYASAGPALLMTRRGVRSLDLARLKPSDLKNAVPGSPNFLYYWFPHPQYPLVVRVSADGNTFAGLQPGLTPNGIRIKILEGDTEQNRYAIVPAGAVQPNYDGSLMFTDAGIYSADLKPVPLPQAGGVFCFPCYHPALFLGISGRNRASGPIAAEKVKLSLYTAGDKHMLASLGGFAELNDLQGGGGALSIDKRIHYFPTANLLVNIPAACDRLVLRRLDVFASLDKAGVNYLFVVSLPPAVVWRGSTFTYPMVVKSRLGGVRYTLSSGPEGMTLSSDGELQWSVPANQPTGHVAVVITIKDASNQEVLHSFNLAIR
ncbi:MAG: serine protease [Thermoguttaceae bacterium]